MNIEKELSLKPHLKKKVINNCFIFSNRSKLTTWKIIGSVFIGIFGITLAVMLVTFLCWKGGKKSGQNDKFKKLSDV